MRRDSLGASRLRLFVPLLGLFASSVSLPATPRLAPEVAFFATGFPELLSSYRAALDTLEYCTRTPAAVCGEGHAMPASGIADMHYFLDRITTFPTASSPPNRARREKLNSAESAPAEWVALRSEYESKLQEFDTEFLGHYGALLHVCKKALDEPDRSALRYEVLRQVTVERYWSMAPEQSRQALGVVDRIAVDTIRQLGDVPKERCAGLIELSKPLLSLYVRRLKPYSQRDCCDVSLEDRWLANVLFTWSTALELEARVRPDVLKEVDAREALSKQQSQQ